MAALNGDRQLAALLEQLRPTRAPGREPTAEDELVLRAVLDRLEETGDPRLEEVRAVVGFPCPPVEWLESGDLILADGGEWWVVAWMGTDYNPPDCHPVSVHLRPGSRPAEWVRRNNPSRWVLGPTFSEDVTVNAATRRNKARARPPEAGRETPCLHEWGDAAGLSRVLFGFRVEVILALFEIDFSTDAFCPRCGQFYPRGQPGRSRGLNAKITSTVRKGITRLLRGVFRGQKRYGSWQDSDATESVSSGACPGCRA